MIFVDRKCTDGAHGKWQRPPEQNGSRLRRCSALYWRFARRIHGLSGNTYFEAERWLHLAELQAEHLIRTEYKGLERKINPRHLARIPGAILLGRDSIVDCTVRDFSPAGVGLILPDTVSLPVEFELTFNHATQHCIAVWRRTERMGLKFNS